MKSPAKHDANKIELKKDPNGLGICIVGGSDTPIVRQQNMFGTEDGCPLIFIVFYCINCSTSQDKSHDLKFFQKGIIIQEIYKNGAAAKDGKLQPGLPIILLKSII